MATEVTLTSYIHNPWDGTVFNTDQIKFDYSNLGFTPSANDSYKSTSGDIFKVYVDGVRIYRNSDSTYATGTGFLEDGDISNSKLNGLTSIDGADVTWASTTDTVWYIDTANQLIYVDQSAITATDLYGEDGKDVSFTSGETIIELRRGVNDESGPSVDFSNASILTEQDLDNSSKNVFHMAQQAVVTAENSLPYNTGTNTYQAYQPGTTTNRKISQVAAPTANDDVVTKTYMENTWLTATDKTNSATVAGISANVTTVAGIASDVTAVAGDATDIGVVAGKATEIGLLGTSAMATASTGHLARLGTAAVLEDMALLGTAAVVEDMGLLGTADCVADMAILGTSDVVADMNVLATADIVADMNTLGTADVVADMNTLGHADVVTDMNLLATADVVADMALLAVPAVITDMDLLGATGVIADMDAIGATGVIGDIETVADNLVGVNAFAARYRVASSAPGSDNDDGDLYYNTTSNQLNVHDGSSWGAIGQTQVQTETAANNAAVAMAIALG